MKEKNGMRKRKGRAGAAAVVVTMLILLLALTLLVVMGVKLLKLDVLFAQADPTSQGTLPDERPSVTYELGDGLLISRIDRYSGIYMEDGTNEQVSDVMMIILENTSDKDLQLARIELVFSGSTAMFEATNLPAGQRVVLLEKNRKPMTNREPVSVAAKNVVFFQESMDLQEDRLELTGKNGSITVKNISGEDISGWIYIYYKNSASDLLYGGITYRTKVNGLAAGETVQLIASHYNPKTCCFLMVECGE